MGSSAGPDEVLQDAAAAVAVTPVRAAAARALAMATGPPCARSFLSTQFFELSGIFRRARPAWKLQSCPASTMRLYRSALSPFVSTTVLLASACGSTPPADSANPDAGAQTVDAAATVDAPVAGGCEKMDLVFVIDDSASMQEEQDNLIANFPAFIEVLDDYVTRYGLPLDYRVAVTTTGRDQRVGYQIPNSSIDWVEQYGANGAFLTDYDCGVTKRWIEGSGTDVSDAFTCLADVGTRGPDIEMPLQALELAFKDRVIDTTNAGFLRDDALLAFVILTDEDDCSRTDNAFILGPPTFDCDPAAPELTELSHFLDFFDSIKYGRGRWAGAVIAGPGPEECTSDFGEAEVAVRLSAFAEAAGGNVAFSSICDGDLASALEDALQRFGDACATFPPID